MTWTITAQRIVGKYGTDYRIGDWVAIKEDIEIVDPTDHDGFEVKFNVTWGAIPLALYNQRDGDVGLPDATFEAGTLRELRRKIEERTS